MRFLNSMNREVIHKMKETEIRRGDIFSYDFGTRIGSIQSGVRPVLVIQADNFNANAPTAVSYTHLRRDNSFGRNGFTI